MGEIAAVTTLRPNGVPVTLTQLLTRVGEHNLHVVNTTQDDPPVLGTSIWDDTTPARVRAGDIVFAIGVATALPSLSEVMTLAAARGAAAVVVREPVPHPWVRDEARRIGAPLLSVPSDVSWEQILTAIRATIGLGGAAPALADDLTSLADAAAASLGGPVEVYDADMSLLAYSNLDCERDDLTIRSILSRRLPADVSRRLRTTGALAQLREGHTPVRFERPGDRPRLVAPMRAGPDLLGSVWLTEIDASLPRHDELMDVARVATALLGRRRLVEDRERDGRAEVLRGALAGEVCAEAQSERLGIGATDRFQLIAYRSSDPHLDPRLRDALLLRMETAMPGATLAEARDRCYVVVPTTQADEDHVRSVVTDVLTTTASRVGARVVAVLASTWTGTDQLPTARAEADRLLELVPVTDTVRVAAVDELRQVAVLAELREVVAERPHLLRGPVETLRVIDETRNTDYLNTLHAYLDAGCDLGRASRSLYIHRNTLRYRLLRIHEESGLDIHDPVARFVTELQLRLSEPKSSTRGVL